MSHISKERKATAAKIMRLKNAREAMDNILGGLGSNQQEIRSRAYVKALALIEDGRASSQLMDLIIGIDDDAD